MAQLPRRFTDKEILMAKTEQPDVTVRYKSASGPWLVDPIIINPGGVDPLGLRQINFDLMDELLPGLNNVAKHIRPFIIVCWAWRRTIQMARERNIELKLSVHQDFVARVEVVYVWSMLQIDENYDDDDDDRSISLPGKNSVAELMRDRKNFEFGSEEWTEFVEARRHSTAFTAAINYGPGLKALRCLEDDAGQPGVKVPVPSLEAALDAFEVQIAPILKHKLFNGWEPQSLSRKKVAEWRTLWELDKPTLEERAAFRERLIGEEASKERKAAISLVADHAELADVEIDVEMLRRAMSASNVDPSTADKWKRMQTRQAFRLSLEVMLEWIVMEIGSSALTTRQLATRFLALSGGGDYKDVGKWLKSFQPRSLCPVAAYEKLQENFDEPKKLVKSICKILALALLGPAEMHDQSGKAERLPLSLATSDAERFANRSPLAFIEQIIDRWIIAQHTLWSVNRGISDQRAGNGSILRLRLVQEEEGWRVTRGRGHRDMPNPTPDRLATAVSLSREAGLIK